MRTSLRYALLFAIPAGTAMGSGIYITTGQQGLGLAFGFGVGAAIFAMVILARDVGSPDERLRDGP